MNKIAIITPFLAQGGLEKVAVTGAEYLKNHFDTTLIVFDTFQVDYEYSGKMIDLEVPLYGLNPLKKILNLFKILSKLKQLQKKENFDLVIVHSELANISTITKIFPKKIVVIHENRFAKNHSKVKNTLFNIFAKNIYNSKNTNKIVTVSEGIRQSFIENFSINGKKIQTIYNPYEINTIINKSKENIDEQYKELFTKNDVLLIAARLSEQKGHKYFFKIFSKFIKNRKSTKLVLFGDGELRNEIINLSKKLNLKTYSIFDNHVYSDNYDVYFLGFNKNPYKYMKNSKLFIMSSIWEGFGNTLVESMACETVVVSTDCKSGPKEIISPNEKDDILKSHFGEFGVLLPKFDDIENINYQEWNITLNDLLSNDILYKKYQVIGIKRAKDFDTSIIMNQWKNLIESELKK